MPVISTEAARRSGEISDKQWRSSIAGDFSIPLRSSRNDESDVEMTKILYLCKNFKSC